MFPVLLLYQTPNVILFFVLFLIILNLVKIATCLASCMTKWNKSHQHSYSMLKKIKISHCYPDNLHVFMWVLYSCKYLKIKCIILYLIHGSFLLFQKKSHTPCITAQAYFAFANLHLLKASGLCAYTVLLFLQCLLWAWGLHL